MTFYFSTKTWDVQFQSAALYGIAVSEEAVDMTVQVVVPLRMQKDD
jgi:hypothetical protein